ncbi:MAG TPA: hypothetical protein DC001_04225 [Clostridiales bacterium]|nr:hypothetical protein [Clostridiales bacterium]HBR09055.1 hypothetical protein [Clostridiales bacterium]
MIPFEEAAVILDEAADALPRVIFEKLNGGINLLPAKKTDADGLLVMGTYFSGQMGRHVEIYYGSFCEAFPDISHEDAKNQLIKTMKHELIHHVEGLAWDRSLEIWDEAHKAELLAGLYSRPLSADSILFVCQDNAGLSVIAQGLFQLAATKTCPMIKCASAGLADNPPEHVCEKAVSAAARYGADISAYVPRRVTRDMVDAFGAVLCMTREQGDELAALFPAFDAKIMCLGETDIQTPFWGGQSGWQKSADRIAGEIEYLIDELCAGG